MRRVHASSLALLLAPWLVAGCFQDVLDPPSIVKSPRILAIVAEPPEAAPGQDVLLRPLVGLPDDAVDAGAIEWRWLVCARAETLMGFGGAQYDQVPRERGCTAGSPGTLELPTVDGRGLLAGAITAAAFDALSSAASAYGDLVTPETLERIVATTGLPLSVQIDLLSGGTRVVSGFKRVVVSTRDVRGTNPPPPRFSVGCEGDASRVWLSARASEDPFVCVPEDDTAGTPAAVAGREVCLAPDPEDQGWLEAYPVIDVTGTVTTGHEDAYYSWFATGGKLSEDTTQAPVRDVRWRAPRDTGTVPIWLVVRDGHGGTSACRADIDVVSP